MSSRGRERLGRPTLLMTRHGPAAAGSNPLPIALPPMGSKICSCKAALSVYQAEQAGLFSTVVILQALKA